MTESIEQFWLDRDKALLVVVDVQERLVPTMPPNIYRKVLRSIEFLVGAARQLQIPVVVTEQYPKGLGPTVPELAVASEGQAIEKLTFGCCGEPGFLTHLQKSGRSQVLVTGMEAHVCVYQTVLGLLATGYHVHLVRDAIIARGKTDFLTALDSARQAGAVVTTAEMAAFQLLRTAAVAEFKAVSALVKERFGRE